MQESDIEEILVVRTSTRENRATMEGLAKYGVTPESTLQIMREKAKGWVCEDSGKIVGFVMGDGKSGEMLVVAVLPDHEGCGIGRHLMGLVQAWLFSKGHEELWLLANRDPSVRASGF